MPDQPPPPRLVTLWKALEAVWSGYTKVVIPLVLLPVVVVVILLVAGEVGPCSCRTSAASRRAKPWEFAYLDTARSASYLGQLTGGTFESENREETTARNSGLGLELNNVGKATSTSSSQLTRSVVVAQTQADKFSELLQDLEGQHPFHELDAARCDFGEKLASSAIPVGTMILIKNALVRMPPYLSAYPELRYALYRLRSQAMFGPAPLYAFRQVDESTRGTPKRERDEFKKTVGPNPRIPFTITVPYTKKEVETCKTQLEEQPHAPNTRGPLEVTVLLPARFARLTGDPSLLSRPLTIVGKVVSNSVGTFGDGLSVSAYWPALSAAKPPLLRELGVRDSFLKMKRSRLREGLFDAMERSVTFEGHVVELIPIAMYD